MKYILRLESILLLSLVVYVLGEWLGSKIPSEAITTVGPLPISWWVAHLMSVIGFTCVIFILIGGGIYRLRRDGRSISMILWVIIGVVWNVVILLLAVTNYQMAEKFYTLTKSQPVRTLSEIQQDKNLNAEAKAIISKNSARQLFVDNGIRAEYLDAQGNRKLYDPTPEDKIEQQEKLKVLNEYQRAQVVAKNGVWQWGITLLSCVIAGFLIPIKSR